MKPKSKTIGNLGEIIVSNYLNNRGFKIIERNYLKKWGEIDVIAERGGTIHFVEVKSISCSVEDTREWFRPEENVHPQKLKRLNRTIQSYLMEKNISDETPWQIDVAGVFLDIKTRKARIRMIENVVI